MLVIKVLRLRPDRPQPETVIAMADQRLAKQVLRLIREAIGREGGDDELTADQERRHLDD